MAFVNGSAGNDTLAGTTADDTFLGSSGSDVIDGGGGHDVLEFIAWGFRGTSTSANTDGSSNLLTSLGLDRFSRIAEVDFVDGRLVFDNSDSAAQISRLYQAAVHRLPDQTELNFWLDQYRADAAYWARFFPPGHLPPSFVPIEMAHRFIDESGEFSALYGRNLSESAFVTQLYANVLGRAPDPQGLAGWLGMLTSFPGPSFRPNVLIGFSESPENIARFAPVVQAGIWDRDEVAAQVARLYDTVLHRLPDLAGLNGWKTAIESRQITLAQAADGFTSSAEFQSIYGTLDDPQFVAALYGNALHRAPDAPGLAGWVDALAAHALTRSGVVLGFSESAEHIGNTAENIQSDTPGHFGILFA
jgi:hypothetical protein